MEGALGFLLKQLRHGGHADLELISHQLQCDLLGQIGFHIGCDLLQKRFFRNGSTGAFAAGLKGIIRRVSLLYERVWTTKASVNRPGNGRFTKNQVQEEDL